MLRVNVGCEVDILVLYTFFWFGNKTNCNISDDISHCIIFSIAICNIIVYSSIAHPPTSKPKHGLGAWDELVDEYLSKHVDNKNNTGIKNWLFQLSCAFSIVGCWFRGNRNQTEDRRLVARHIWANRFRWRHYICLVTHSRTTHSIYGWQAMTCLIFTYNTGDVTESAQLPLVPSVLCNLMWTQSKKYYLTCY